MSPARIKPHNLGALGPDGVGGLGPDLEREDVQAAREKQKKKQEYSNLIRERAKVLQAQKQAEGRQDQPRQEPEKAKSKAEVAREYAKQIKRPTLKKVAEEPKETVQEGPSLLETLLDRHQEERERVRPTLEAVKAGDFAALLSTR